MPIFQYLCDKCKRTTDKLVSRADADEGKTFECGCKGGGTLSKDTAPTAAALRFRGNWSGTTGSF